MKILLISLLLASIAINAEPVLAQSLNETITITTYYPSPTGSYERIHVNQIVIGDSNQDGVKNVEDQPALKGSIAFEPTSGNPSGWPLAKKGELAYSGDNEAFYYFNSSRWIKALAPGAGGEQSGPAQGEMCGNGFCDVGETCSSCENDCGSCVPVGKHKDCAMNVVAAYNPGIRRTDLDRACRSYCQSIGGCMTYAIHVSGYTSGVRCRYEVHGLPAYPVRFDFRSCAAVQSSTTLATGNYCINNTVATCNCRTSGCN